MDKKDKEHILRISHIESKIDSIENKVDKILSILEEGTVNTPPKKTKNIIVKKGPSKKIPIKKGNCSLNVYKDVLLIGGDTFDRRDLIKGFGARWNPENKGWTVNCNKLDHVKGELEKYFESVNFNDKNKKKNLISLEKNNEIEHSDENVSFGSGGGCDIESDSDC